ncbi:hypothetical protein KIY80_gp62 [Mycobacterium phage Benvolio]|uniref:AP2/ERF domain-containing protein n=1 Tax=Mycobacterium phage Benvolio TaxID=2591074 RepID=A0A514A3N9_9CAUD|nr:hypothetical protein CH13_gp065 [Mycobacterium phage Echild]YP_010063499.1 hypothetical protein KIY80_gp62 [Mycobacterium phage Benvolio]AHG24286.1 hypothetical protein PBI_ECHILD_65 [Mycobacterium phage Echild]QDH47879.1 hypothetical protein SEA_BENVOLIO_62 [Mycobacterium phage Benvolio]
MTQRINFDNVEQVTVRRSSSPKKPYPHVRFNKGSWEGTYSNNGRVQFLGCFKTPELARIAVLHAQAEYLEAKARNYRAEAELLRRN